MPINNHGILIRNYAGYISTCSNAIIIQVQTKETVEENVNTTEKVFQDRQYLVGTSCIECNGSFSYFA